MVTGSPLMRICPESAGCAPDERVHQRRLAGAVATDEGDDLAGVQVDGDAVDGVDAAEGDTDVAHLDQRDVARGCDGACGVVGGAIGHRSLVLLSAHGRPVWMMMAETINPATSGSRSQPCCDRAGAPSRWRPP